MGPNIFLAFISLFVVAVVIVLVKMEKKRCHEKVLSGGFPSHPSSEEIKLLAEFPRSRWEKDSDLFLKSDKNRVLFVTSSDLSAFLSGPYRAVLVLYLPNGGQTELERKFLQIFSQVCQRNWNEKHTIVPLLAVDDRYKGSEQPAVVLWDCGNDTKFTGNFTTENLIGVISGRCFAACLWEEFYKTGNNNSIFSAVK